jgi:hypothetical protein
MCCRGWGNVWRGKTPKLEEMKDGPVLEIAARHWRDGWEVSRLSHKWNVTRQEDKGNARLLV